MSRHFRTCAAAADAAADATCFRRLLNAALSIVAVWLLNFAVLERWPQIVDHEWSRLAAMSLTVIASAFAAWAMTFGDRIVWREAFRTAHLRQSGMHR